MPFDPTTHPLWDRQVELERYMLQAGAERFRDRLKHARENEELTRMKPYRRLMQEWIEPITKGVTEWIETTSKKRGVKPVALEYMKILPPEVVALITVRTVLDRMAANKLLLISVADSIGTLIEYEARTRAWEASGDESFGGLQENMSKRRSTPVHRQRVNINLFNKKGRNYVEWQDWANDHRKHLGLACVDILVRYTKHFEVRPEYSIQRKKKIMRPPMVIAMKDDLMDWLSDAMEFAEIATPLYLPSIIPPKKWEGPRDGGYYTNIIRRPFMIRFKTSQEEERGNAIADFEALDMPNVYKAINIVQSVPWKINKRVLEVMKRMWELDLGLAGIPRQGPLPLPAKTWIGEPTEQQLKDWKKEASKIHGANAKRISHLITAKRNLNLAEMYANEEQFYFPHIFDFRGRIYPVPVALNPQGNDIARGLITFAEGKKISTEAGTTGWLGIHLANCWGNDKVSYEDRIKWVEENTAKWERIAADPMADKSWCSSPGKQPWQTLAAIFEIVDFWKHGDGYTSCLPIRVDGTCNGIQHLSAMLRDEVGGAAVNLTPSETPRDIYQEVADLVTKAISDLEDPIAKTWLRMCNGRLPRSLTKRPVMILPYGGSRNAYTKYTLKWLEEADPDEAFVPKKERFAHAKWMAHVMWEIVGAHLIRPQEVMEWIKKCARAASKGHQRPLYWTTPCGFVVRHFYGKRRMTRIETVLDGKRIQVVNWKTTAELSNKDVLTAISPNFVHSLDASALMSTILRVRQSGVRYMTTIHDSFGALAADMWTVHDALRECFIETYEKCPLEEFRAACVDVAGSDKGIPPVPTKGTLDIKHVRESTYFFA